MSETKLPNTEQDLKIYQVAGYDEDKVKAIRELISDGCNERFAAAEKYIDECEQLNCQGAVYSESGFYYKDVMMAIQIASGKIEQSKTTVTKP